MKPEKQNKFTATLIAFFLAVFAVSAQDLTHFKQNKSSVHGSLSATAIFYNSSGITPRKDPFSYILNGNLVINLKGLVLPFSFTYSDRNKSFRQPFNQFGISPKYKWITLHLGYRNINFSQYVLGGHTVYGAGIELNPGKFRFGFLYGRLRRKTNHAVNVNNPLSDTLPAFTRKMISFKIGVGTPKNFFDLVVLRAADDSASLDSIARANDNYPATNLVVGINSRFTILKHIHLEMEGAYSIYTSDQTSDLTIDAPPFLTKIIPINITSQGFMALRGLLEYRNRKGMKIGVAYRRVDPGYKSMGSYFINDDLENITFHAAFNAMKRKLNFNGSIGFERNNLKTVRNATTHKMIGSAMLAYNPAPVFGINFNYSNYTINQQAGRIQIADSVKLYQTNGTLMIMPHFQFINNKKTVSQAISLIYNRMDLKNKNPDSRYNNSFTTHNSIVTYSISFLPLVLTATASFNYNQVIMASGNSKNIGGTLGITKGFSKNKISLGLATNLTESINDLQTYLVITPALTFRAKAGKHHVFRVKANMISTDNKTSNKLSKELTGYTSYVFSF